MLRGFGAHEATAPLSLLPGKRAADGAVLSLCCAANRGRGKQTVLGEKRVSHLPYPRCSTPEGDNLRAVTNLLLCSGRLIIHPDRSYFFRYDNVSFSCSGPPHLSEHLRQTTRVFRNASSQQLAPCESGWGIVDGHTCTIEELFTLDSGVYWCGTERNQTGDSINITVTSDPVLLSVPIYPILLGTSVTLACLSNHPNNNKFEASFFRDADFLGIKPSATLTLPSVTRKDEGLYRCEIASRGRSKQVPLRISSENVHAISGITMTTPPSTNQPITIAQLRPLWYVLLFLLYTGILCIGFSICRKLIKDRTKEDKEKVPSL
ncbi:hypothetical protein WMY93_014696 [Mugilogobius chulae]|uniref:Ig-like domain-containing protein n=1 Tax=Mugilogobius chulae TaxID=88201 RepID=A0AAW0P2A8_9GOBI